MESNNPSQNNNYNGPFINTQEGFTTSNNNYVYQNRQINNNNILPSYGDANRQHIGGSNASIQFHPSSYASHTGQANANPPPTANNIPFLNMVANPLQSNHDILSFDIPGFKIIIIPVDNSSSNIIS